MSEIQQITDLDCSWNIPENTDGHVMYTVLHKTANNKKKRKTEHANKYN